MPLPKVEIDFSLKGFKTTMTLLTTILFFLFIVSMLVFSQRNKELSNEIELLKTDKGSLEHVFQETKTSFQQLAHQDQVQVNQMLNAEITNIHNTFSQAVSVYELLADENKFDPLFSKALSELSKKDYQTATATLNSLKTKLDTQKQEVAQTEAASLTVSNTPPSSGYSRQQVQTSAGTFTISLVSADLGSTKVLVDTASDSDCHSNCPALPLATYVSRNNAFAAVNGSYFCPADYPSCAGKENTFDTLLMNKNKTYFNSDNNVYSSVPAAIFQGSSARFVAASQEWGRDTSVDAVIANQGLLVQNGQITFTSTGDPKMSSKGNRSFVGTTGSTLYIGVVHNATVAESAIVLHTLGIQNALNLDNGGSTALWSGGYKVGPGRAIPNALLLVQR